MARKKRKGWIKLDRELLSSPVWDNGEPYDHRSAWVYLIAIASYEDSEIWIHGKMHIIKRGQILTSMESLGKTLGWCKSKVSRYLQELELAKMIYKDSYAWGTVITLVNYDFYQSQ